MDRLPEIAVFGGGCFWCTEAVFRELKGVMEVMAGYAGGTKKNPTYERISSGESDHAEVIRIVFDPAVISYRDLLTVFFATHNPKSLNRQGNDAGAQYRSLVLYSNSEQKAAAEKYIAELGDGIVTRIEPLGEFYDAEEYHRDYYRKNAKAPYCELMIDPKLAKVREQFAELLAG